MYIGSKVNQIFYVDDDDDLLWVRLRRKIKEILPSNGIATILLPYGDDCSDVWVESQSCCNLLSDAGEYYMMMMVDMLVLMMMTTMTRRRNKNLVWVMRTVALLAFNCREISAISLSLTLFIIFLLAP